MSTKHRWKVRVHLDLTDEMIDVLDDYGSQFVKRERTQITGERGWMCSDPEGTQPVLYAWSEDDPHRRHVDHTQLTGACDLLFRNHGGTQAAGWMLKALANDDPGWIDAEVADVVWQLATYGDIVFG